MCNHNTSNDNSNATTNDNLNLSDLSTEDRDVYERNAEKLYAKVYKEIYTDPNITSSELRVYILILGYCGSLGACFRKRSDILAEFPSMKESTFRENLASLHKKGYLYRHQQSKHRGGSKCYLVVKCKKDAYIKFLKSKRYFQTVRDVQDYFNNPPALSNKELTLDKQGAGNPAVDVRAPEIQRSNITSNIVKTKRDVDETAAPPFSPSFDGSKKPLYGKSISNMLEAGPPKTEQEITVQKLVIHFQDQPEPLIKEYVLQNWEKLKGMNNPVAYGVRAIQGGALERTKAKGLERATATNEKNIEIENRELAEHMIFKYSRLEWVRLVLHPASFKCEVDTEWKLSVMEKTKPRFAKEVSFRDPKFKSIIKGWENGINESL